MMSWKNPPTRFKKTLEGDVDKLTQRVALKLLRELVVISPVDTGRFVGNWVVGIGRRNTAKSVSADPGRSIALRRGAQVIKRHRGPRSIFLSNNLPYAARLNEGWSQQAPANFVEKAIAKVTK